jgi:hypothetical protein
LSPVSPAELGHSVSSFSFPSHPPSLPPSMVFCTGTGLDVRQCYISRNKSVCKMAYIIIIINIAMGW